MNKFFITVFFLVFGGWFVLGTNWYVCYIKNECANHTLEEALALLGDEDASPDIAEEILPENVEVKDEYLKLAEPKPKLESVKPAMASKKILKPKKSLYEFEILDGKILFSAGNGSPKSSAEVLDHLKSVVRDFSNDNAGFQSLEVTGHTDDYGKASANTELGFKRARAIKALLVEFGLSKEKVKVKSIGQFRPLGDNKTPEGRKLNRRVEIVFR